MTPWKKQFDSTFSHMEYPRVDYSYKLYTYIIPEKFSNSIFSKNESFKEKISLFLPLIQKSRKNHI